MKTMKAITVLLCLLFAGNWQLSQAAEQVIYYHVDHLGSPIAATDEGGALLWREEYRPYGDRINSEPDSALNKRWYTGHPHDNTTGLTYAGARFYDPVVGRFMAVDPQPFTENIVHSFNRYAYGNNSPYKFIDPDGRVPLLALIPPLLEAIGIGGTVYIATNPEARAQLGSAIGQGIDHLGSRLSAGGYKIGPVVVAPILNEGLDEGCIYCVSGQNTASGRDYVGSTDNLDQRARDKSDGRDRTGATVIDTYPKGDRNKRRSKEQQAINDRGGVENLDNRRNEVAPRKWEDMDIKPPS